MMNDTFVKIIIVFLFLILVLFYVIGCSTGQNCDCNPFFPRGNTVSLELNYSNQGYACKNDDFIKVFNEGRLIDILSINDYDTLQVAKGSMVYVKYHNSCKKENVTDSVKVDSSMYKCVNCLEF